MPRIEVSRVIGLMILVVAAQLARAERVATESPELDSTPDARVEHSLYYQPINPSSCYWSLSNGKCIKTWQANLILSIGVIVVIVGLVFLICQGIEIWKRRSPRRREDLEARVVTADSEQPQPRALGGAVGAVGDTPLYCFDLSGGGSDC